MWLRGWIRPDARVSNSSIAINNGQASSSTVSVHHEGERVIVGDATSSSAPSIQDAKHGISTFGETAIEAGFLYKALSFLRLQQDRPSDIGPTPRVSRKIGLIAGMLFITVLAGLLCGIIIPLVEAHKHHGSGSSLVDLGYSKYQGNKSTNGITQWLGMRYAAPPVGNLRFRAPQDPVCTTAVQNATQHGATCLGQYSHAVNGFSEDCLFVDVFAPSNAENLPVYVFIQGGGFNGDSNANFSGNGLIAASDNNIIIVTFNYRVAIYGFLASKEVVANGDTNVGLKDQRKVFEWVQKYISKFGGDPNHVTIGGDSAGAASVDLQLSAYGGRNDHLFHASAAESQSFGVQFTVEESQYQYDTFVNRVGCSNFTDTLSCLRNKSSAQLQTILNEGNYAAPGATGPPLFMFSNVIDGDFTTDYTYNLFAQGKYVKLPAIWGADSNDGNSFANTSTDSVASMNAFLVNQFPNLTTTQLAQIDAYYPEGAQYAGKGTYFTALGAAYGDMRYKCPGYHLAQQYSLAGIPVWNYHYAVVNNASDGYGAAHTVELNAIWGPANIPTGSPYSYLPGGANANMIPVMQGYWTSFIRSFNPNTYRAAGTPVWEEFVASKGNRIMFQTNATAMETVGTQEALRCDYLSSIGPSIGQ